MSTILSEQRAVYNTDGDVTADPATAAINAELEEKIKNLKAKYDVGNLFSTSINNKLCVKQEGKTDGI